MALPMSAAAPPRRRLFTLMLLMQLSPLIRRRYAAIFATLRYAGYAVIASPQEIFFTDDTLMLFIRHFAAAPLYATP